MFAVLLWFYVRQAFFLCLPHAQQTGLNRITGPPQMTNPVFCVTTGCVDVAHPCPAKLGSNVTLTRSVEVVKICPSVTVSLNVSTLGSVELV